MFIVRIIFLNKGLTKIKLYVMLDVVNMIFRSLLQVIYIDKSIVIAYLFKS